jgi:site-specific DNA-adenine methylase
MFSYYGSKSKIVRHYPPPKYGTIIEPFAGSARYALRYWDREVIINDKYDTVARVWKFLQQCSPGDILGLPDLKAGDKLEREKYDCIEMAWLLGFMIATGKAQPNLTMSPRGAECYQREKRCIAANLYKIKHWQILNLDYTELQNRIATWFIDPPYWIGGKYYIESSAAINYEQLAEYCRTRLGQTIVCEKASAEWLPFVPMRNMRTSKGTGVEGIWCNEATSFDNVQLKLGI